MTDDFVPFAQPDITEAEIDAVVETMRNGWLTTGPNAAAFEKEFADFITGGAGGVHAVAVNSATAGLHLSYEALGLGPGDEVLVPTWTFTSTGEAARYLGADPVFVDSDPDTLCLNIDDAANRVTERTKLIAPVHFGGVSVPNQQLADFAAAHDLKVVEDAAHSLPTLNEGKMIGTHGHDATVYSFYATKTMATGEGGMVLTPHEELAQRMRTMRLHGINRDVFDRYISRKPSWQYDVVAPGYKYNLPDTAAAMGRVQLRRLPEMTARRAAIAARYDEALADLPLQLPAHAAEGSSHAWHLYVARLSEGAPVDRDTFIARMAEERVGTSVHFIPMHLQPYWRDTYHLTPEMFPVATAEFARVVSLPIFSSMTDQQVDRVIAAVRHILS